LENDADVYLSSAEVAAIAAKLGRIPTVEEYLSAMQGMEPTSNDIYQYLNCFLLSDGFLITLLRLYQVQYVQPTFDIVIFGQS
jgi:hypothetical protein